MSLASSKPARVVGSFALAGAAAFVLVTPLVAAPVSSPAYVIEGLASPESVVSLGSRHFVSNMGVAMKSVEKDGDGFISEIDDGGRVVDLHAFPRTGGRLDAPKGLAIVGERIFVADIDRVVGFDVNTHAQVFEAVLGGNGPALLNDLAVEDDHSLFVSDTLRKAIYRLDLNTRAFSTIADNIPGANGIVIDQTRHTLYVVCVGADFAGGGVFRVPLDGKGAPQMWDSPHGILDGVALLPNGDLLISDWVAADRPTEGTLTRYTQDGKRVGAVDLPAGSHGPADFSYDAATGKLWIPLMPDNRVLVIDLRQ